MVASILYRFLHSPFAIQVLSLGFCILFFAGFFPRIPSLYIGEQFGVATEVRPLEFLEIETEGFLSNPIGTSFDRPREVLVKDSNGNFVRKIISQRRENEIKHIVRSGESIHRIAKKYDLRISTILWANNLNIKKSIRVGQSLRIPPVDGVYYRIQKGDTLETIAKSHRTDISKIAAYNNIKPNKIRSNYEIFIPNAQKIFISQRVPTGTTPRKNFGLSQNKNTKSIGFVLRRPTTGILTQGYKRGHYALDIANRINTPIYATEAGRVIKSSNGWNYGYGNYVIIDHGNKVHTLYSHLNLRKVKYNQEVKAGQLIGLMGNSGRVFGVTGVHLHFELRINGRKVNPQNYF